MNYNFKFIKFMLCGFACSAILSACVNQPSFVGYLTNDSNEIVFNLSPVSYEEKAIILRSKSDNLLDIQIFGPKKDKTLLSTLPSSYSILVTFSSSKELPEGEVEYFVPTFKSHHFGVSKVSISRSKHEILFALESDRLGVDLLLTTLVAPGGLQGVVFFQNGKISIPLDGRAFRSEFAWAKISTSRSAFGRLCFEIENISEYPYIIWSIRTAKALSDVVNRIVNPRQKITECVNHEEFSDPKKVMVLKERVKAVPNIAHQMYIAN